ncbi:NAD-dependent epimerase [Lentzea sp. NBRC 105346]|uniref:epimerase n=1 Tax=Lentzea sp. NBRC 105346 TaxID=3032205 RepID=UPI0024A0AB02|nr:DUF1731 domain-containing protein [Lentzea sp. NBRC 105346]GLZ35511.1 NAD-dependent epimerase [Lentzea sp. NBRC 105346]
MGDVGKIVIPGGSGHIGTFLSRSLAARGHEVVVLGRGFEGVRDGVRHVRWDGRTPGPWAAEIDGAAAVVNLAGRSVSCRYTKNNLTEMMASRVDSARAVGAALAQASAPPPVWLQMSTATIYAHRFDQPNDEATGMIGGHEPDVPGYWRFSVDIATAWERAMSDADLPGVRKVALRTAIVMAPGRGGAFDVLRRMARLGLGGPAAGGRQYMSWLHWLDFVLAVEFLLENEISGPVNLAAPNPLPQRDFVRALRRACGMPFGLPATAWMASLGAFALRSDPELLLKSRFVVPGVLLDAGFEFQYPRWPEAAADLT